LLISNNNEKWNSGLRKGKKTRREEAGGFHSGSGERELKIAKVDLAVYSKVAHRLKKVKETVRRREGRGGGAVDLIKKKTNDEKGRGNRFR